MKLELNPLPRTKLHSKWIKDLSACVPEIVKLLEENRKGDLLDFDLSN